ncbi:MAG: hypothetical protein EXQ93_00140 [Alphaproteobacteria bacterium]|nr:hypothetical protein [Alphaproteobacteria bacterium]
METVTALLDKILFWHWGIVAVTLGALEMLFAGGILMGAAIAAALVGAAAFAIQQFPGALPPTLRFDLLFQLLAFAVLSAVFALAMRIGRRRAAAMIAQAAAPPNPAGDPAVPAAAPGPQPLAAAPAAVTPIAPPPIPAKLSPQPPVMPVVRPAPAAAPVAAALPPPPAAAPAKPSRPFVRPAGNQPMRVAGPTAITTPPAPQPQPRPVQRAQPPAPPAAPPATARPAVPAPVAEARPRSATLAKGKPNPADFVGREYTLWKPMDGGRGSLRISAADWVLLGPDVAAGARVRVIGVEGPSLRIEPAWASVLSVRRIGWVAMTPAASRQRSRRPCCALR